MLRHRVGFALALCLFAPVAGCGARSSLREVPAVDVTLVDAMDAPDVVDVTDVTDVPDVTDASDACVPVADGCLAREFCGNGVDDDCNGQLEEGCSCVPGAVQSCFRGPPGRRNVGVCRDGTQTCEMSGRWGPCMGDIVPREDVCNGADNLCNGCSQRRDCAILCPSPGDPRVPDAAPLRSYALRGGDFYMGPARTWSWQVTGGPCDRVSRRPSFDLTGATAQNATFFPRLSGDYGVTLTVVTGSGATLSCNWVVHVEGPGLRVEMCYPENERLDLDLYVHRPGTTTAWFRGMGTAFDPLPDSCGWHNCEATIRQMDALGRPVPRADWGYAPSPLAECENGPQGDQWRRLGFCANPRLDIDNNLAEGIGVPENVNIDRPREGETFRVMVQNFSGDTAHPLVNVYCSGRRVATYGAPPDVLMAFRGPRGDTAPGAMWRVADVTTHVDARGRTQCDVQGLHPPGSTRGYWVTVNDPSY
jgi:hypothetical protein